ncbi:MAG: hypothetical protein ACOC4B_03455 [Bacteroidota bacterium]
MPNHISHEYYAQSCIIISHFLNKSFSNMMKSTATIINKQFLFNWLWFLKYAEYVPHRNKYSLRFLRLDAISSQARKNGATRSSIGNTSCFVLSVFQGRISVLPSQLICSNFMFIV